MVLDFNTKCVVAPPEYLEYLRPLQFWQVMVHLRSFYYHQIARQLDTLSARTLQREFDTLSQLGLIERSTVGKQVFYHANRNHPIFAELRALVAKTVGTIPMLRSALTPFADRISVAFIYGSMARKEEKAGSDIDLMIDHRRISQKSNLVYTSS